MPFPAVLKPLVPMALRRRTGLKVALVERRDRLDEAFRRFGSCGALLLQEVVPVCDDAVFIAGTYHDAASRPLAVFTGRKLRQHPKGFGDTRAGESRWCDELAGVTLRLLDGARYHGIADVEFKRDERDGRLKLMEVNARQGLWGPLATASGVNLCPSPTATRSGARTPPHGRGTACAGSTSCTTAPTAWGRCCAASSGPWSGSARCAGCAPTAFCRCETPDQRWRRSGGWPDAGSSGFGGTQAGCDRSHFSSRRRFANRTSASPTGYRRTLRPSS